MRKKVQTTHEEKSPNNTCPAYFTYFFHIFEICKVCRSTNINSKSCIKRSSYMHNLTNTHTLTTQFISLYNTILMFYFFSEKTNSTNRLRFAFQQYLLI